MATKEQGAEQPALYAFRKILLSRWGGVAREAIPRDMQDNIDKLGEDEK
jgi:hypothetical protein